MKHAVKLLLEVIEEDGFVLEGQGRTLNWGYNHLVERANKEKENFKATGNKE